MTSAHTERERETMMIRTYTLSDGTKAVFEYDHNGIGKITLEDMDILMSLLKATVDEDEPQTEENKIPEYAPWRDAFDGMDCCSMEVQDDNGNDID